MAVRFDNLTVRFANLTVRFIPRYYNALYGQTVRADRLGWEIGVKI